MSALVSDLLVQVLQAQHLFPHLQLRQHAIASATQIAAPSARTETRNIEIFLVQHHSSALDTRLKEEFVPASLVHLEVLLT